MAHPSFKSPNRLAPPRPRPRTVAAPRPTLRRCEETGKTQQSSQELIPHPPPATRPNNHYGTPTPSFAGLEKPGFQLKRGLSSNTDLTAKDMYECTFQPMPKVKTEDMLKELLQGHRELKAKIESQEQVLFELCGGGAQAPTLRVLSRDGGMRPPGSALPARRAYSSLISVSSYRPKSERPSVSDDSAERILSSDIQRGPNPPSAYHPVWHYKLNTDRENLDSVGSSKFIYPSSVGVFPAVTSARQKKRYKSAPRPARFPKDVFPMMVRARPMLD